MTSAARSPQMPPAHSNSKPFLFKRIVFIISHYPNADFEKSCKSGSRKPGILSGMETAWSPLQKLNVDLTSSNRVKNCLTKIERGTLAIIL